MDTQAHPQGIGRFLAHQRRCEIAEERRSRCCADTGVEGDQKHAATHTPHELLCGHRLQFAVLFLETQECPGLVLPAPTEAVKSARVMDALLVSAKEGRSVEVR